MALIDFLDARLEPLDAELRPFATADPRAVLLDTIPGIAELLALTIAVEVGANPWHGLYVDISARSGNHNSAKAAVARKILIAAWHMLSRNQPSNPAPRSTRGDSVPASSRLALAA